MSDAATASLRVWAEVDLDLIAHNLAEITRLVAPARVMAVVKADAYGHGAVPVARTLEDAGAATLGTSTVGEGLILREAGIKLPIVVLGPVPGEEDAAASADLAVTLVDEDGLSAAAAAGRKRGRPVRVHLKVDTGMTRLGAPPEKFAALLERAAASPHLAVEGVFTHLASAENDREFARVQVARFRPLADLAHRRLPGVLRHVTNTAGMIVLPDARYDMVRAGLGIYGLLPAPDLTPSITLHPAMSLWARVVQVRAVAPGTTVSYGRAHHVSAPTRVAAVAIGYGDGYPRLLSGRGQIQVGGRRCPVIGRVTMDYTMLDVGADGPAVKAGDPVMVWGPDLSAHEVAEAASTIAYEILCGIGPRVCRLYRAGGRLVGRRDQRAADGVAAPLRVSSGGSSVGGR